MSGDLSMWFTTGLVVFAVVLVLITTAVLLPRAARTMTTRFFCPWRKRSVVVQYLTCEGRTAVCVLSCTAFADPRLVTCGTPCLGGDGRTDLAPRDGTVASLLAD